MVKGGILM